MEKIELQDCPNCGARPDLQGLGQLVYVGCGQENCQMAGPVFGRALPEEAARVWNSIRIAEPLHVDLDDECRGPTKKPPVVERIARIAHEVNRAYCLALGDLSQSPWECAPQWQRESAIAGVRFHLENPEEGPDGSHREWLRVKLANGWTFGPVKDEKKKQHPCMVSFERLPVEQQAKDWLFRGVVHALAGGE